jgi:hypothetical protein
MVMVKDSDLMTLREINRATLARQMLLAREKTTTNDAIERLVALQAQVARPPFIGLWTRVAGFRRDDLLGLIHAHAVVRATAVRGTLHLMTARDFVRLRGAMQPALTAGMQSILRDRAKAIDVDALVAIARREWDARPGTFADLRAALLKRFPKGDERAMGYAVRTHLPIVQVPTIDESPWGYPATTDFACADTWIGKPVGADPAPDALVLRYLAAFGPATAADVQTWSALSGIAPVLERLRKQLVTFTDERGRELFDLPKAPRPSADTPAPVRFLPDFDNLVLSHADRTRVVADAHRPALVTKNLQVRATFLVDGFVAGTWTVERKKAAAALAIAPFGRISRAVREALEEEGLALLRFAEPDAEKLAVRFS